MWSHGLRAQTNDPDRCLCSTQPLIARIRLPYEGGSDRDLHTVSLIWAKLSNLSDEVTALFHRPVGQSSMDTKHTIGNLRHT
jgi:hypothetical protein